MTATAPPPVANRIARHFAPPLPQTSEERQAVWADTLAAAMLFYQRQLASPVAHEAAEAARAVFDLEKTRLRHGRDLAGADPPPEPDVLPPLEPLYQVKACEQTLDAAVKAGAFDEGDREDAEPPVVVEEKTDEELVAQYEAERPEKFAWWLGVMREVLEKRGRPCDDAAVKRETRWYLAQKLAGRRAESAGRSEPRFDRRSE
jgi:hypothetical protein